MIALQWTFMNKTIATLVLVTLLVSASWASASDHLTNEFVSAILQDRKPLVDVCAALNMTCLFYTSDPAAEQHGVLMKVPQFTLKKRISGHS